MGANKRLCLYYVFSLCMQLVTSCPNLQVIRDNAQSSSTVTTLECSGSSESKRWLKDDLQVDAATDDRVTVEGSVLRISGLNVSDEGVYRCCVQQDCCSEDYLLYVPLMLDTTLNSTHIAFINDPQHIPCGVLRGRLPANIRVTWDNVTQSATTILRYTSQGGENMSDSSGRFSYDPETSALLVSNFSNYTSSPEPLVLTCTVERLQPHSRQIRTIRVFITDVIFQPSNPCPITHPGLCPVTVTNSLIIRMSVLGKAVGGVNATVHVEWLMGGRAVNNSRYSIRTHTLPALLGNFMFFTSTLESKNVLEEDTDTRVTAMASLSSSTSIWATTRIIKLPVLRNLIVAWYRGGTDILITFDPSHDNFPSLRDLMNDPAIIVLELQFRRSDCSTCLLTASVELHWINLQDLREHGVIISQLDLPQELRGELDAGPYHVQARLGINEVMESEWSEVCHSERNVYPPAGEQEGVLGTYEFSLSFYQNQTCNSMNADSISAAIIGSYITGTDEDISHCFDLVQSSLRCSSDTSGSFTATLVSFASNPPRFDRDSALEAASDLPFTISQAYHATPPPTTVLVPTTTISTSDEVPEEETLHTLVGVAVGVPLLLLLVVTGLAVVYWRKQKRKPAEANAKSVAASSAPMIRTTQHIPSISSTDSFPTEFHMDL